MKVVSIIMPCYNVEQYIQAALESVFNQTYKNIELIIVNDGSTDNTLNIIHSLISKATVSKSKIIDQQNQGLSEARNSGLKEATGEFIYFFDSDDLMDAELVSECVDFMQVNHLDLVHFNCELLVEDELSIQEEQYFKNKLYEDRKVYTMQDFSKKFIHQPRVPVWLYFYRHQFLKEKQLTFYPNLLHEDELFTTLSLTYARKIGFINRKYFIRRLRKNSIMSSSKNMDKKIWSKNVIITELNEVLKKEKLNDSQKNLIRGRLFAQMTDLVKMKVRWNANHLSWIFRNGPYVLRYCFKKIQRRVVQTSETK
ncbi:MAG: glycosyltransferase family 2 protein [Enterococcus sp.]